MRRCNTHLYYSNYLIIFLNFLVFSKTYRAATVTAKCVPSTFVRQIKKNGELSISATRPQSRSCSSIGFLINYEIFLFGFGRLGGGQARWGRHNFWCTWKTPSKKGTLFAFPLTIQFLVFLSFRWVSVWLLRKM